VGAYLATEVGNLSVGVECVAADCGFDGVHFGVMIYDQVLWIVMCMIERGVASASLL
jgi:hypothetical protein